VYNIWFPYTRLNIGEIKEGGFIAVKNFKGLTGSPKYSILEIVSALPVHYALGSTARETERAYPGFVVEAAKAARQDWEQEEPLEQTTKIRASAIPTGIQVVFQEAEYATVPDESMPMIGEEALLLTNDTTYNIVNKGLTTDAVPHIQPCWLVQNEDIKVCISTGDLLRTHFGMFGFTGSGKSNLISTLIAELSRTRGLKIVLFDLMLEYTGLLIDLLVERDDAFILSLDIASLPGGDSLENVLRGDESQEEEAANNIANTLLLPRELAPVRDLYRDPIKNMIRSDKFKLFSPGRGIPTAETLYTTISEELPSSSRLGTGSTAVEEWLISIEELGSSPVNREFIQRLEEQVQDFLDNGIPESFAEPEDRTSASQQTLFSPTATPTGREPTNRIQLSPTARGYFIGVRRKLSTFLETPDENPIRPQVSMNEIVQMLNNPGSSDLIVVHCNRDDDLRQFSSRLVMNLFHNRRRRGANAPQVLFVYDEADEFMPFEARGSYAQSRSAITTLARRGRKFGLGLSFATQRVAYLDTSILAQAHTYLISKLPRQHDREVVSQAFGLSEDILRRTLKFTKGQWLLVSYDATGLENVPLPVRFPNANIRVRNFLEGFNEAR